MHSTGNYRKRGIDLTARFEGDLTWHGGSFSASTLIAQTPFPYKNGSTKKPIPPDSTVLFYGE